MPAPTATSLIDAVDDQNRPIGLVERADVFRARANFRTVHILVFNSAGELLLQRLGAHRARHPLQWGSSVAGYLHAGESYLSAARRRLSEELALRVPLREVGVTPMTDGDVKKFVGVFTTTADNPVIADRDHMEEIRFWKLDRLRRELIERPDEFTESFLHVVGYWSSSSA